MHCGALTFYFLLAPWRPREPRRTRVPGGAGEDKAGTEEETLQFKTCAKHDDTWGNVIGLLPIVASFCAATITLDANLIILAHFDLPEFKYRLLALLRSN